MAWITTNKGPILEMLGAWLITLPAAAGLGCLGYLLLTAAVR